MTTPDFNIPEDQAQDELKLISSLVTKYLPPSFDRESLVQDIWMEVHRRNVPITSYMVRGRAIDIMRKNGRQREHLRGYNPQPTPHLNTSNVTEALGLSNLTLTETRVVYQYFYKGETQKQVARTLEMSLGTVALILKSALQKIKDVYFNGV